MNIEEAFWHYVKKTDGCWLWTGSLACGGYGRLAFSVPAKRVMSVHRASWIIHFGEPGLGMCVLHKCDNPACVNPDHLFLGTLADNVRDMVQKGRHNRGIDNYNAKLTEDQVRAIRTEYVPRKSGSVIGRLGPQEGSLHWLAKKYNVSASVIAYVVKCGGWKHVK